MSTVEDSPLPPLPRRVVTAVNKDGRSLIASDGPIPKDASFSEPGVGSGGDHWIVSRVPVDLADQRDALQGYTIKSWPAPGEVIARMITWLPGFEFPMHRSDTLDVFFVIAGQIELLLNEETTVVRPGEAVIQCGTNHGWRVVGDAPCTIAGVLIDAAPLSREGVSTNTDASDRVSVIERMFAALGENDRAGLDDLLCEDFYAFENGVRMSGPELLDLMSASYAQGRRYRWSVASPQVEVQGDLATVVYRNEGAVTPEPGAEPVPLSWLETVLLRRQSGRWRVAFLHSTRTQTVQGTT